MKFKTIIMCAVSVIAMSACGGKNLQCQQLEDSSWKNLSNDSKEITITIEGKKYYGKFYYSDTKQFYLHPLIGHITGNSKGVLISDNCNTLTCVANLEKESKSGTGYCLENGNNKLRSISIVNNYAIINN